MATINGTSGADILAGGDADDVIFGNGGGSDIITTGGGADRIVVEGDAGAFILASDFDPGNDVFDFSNLGVDADDVQIVETSTIEADRGNSGLGGLGGLEIQVNGAETIALPQFSSADDINIDDNFVFDAG